MRKRLLVTSLVMALVMSVCMALVMTLLNVGPGPHFGMAFLQSLAIGFVVSFPISYFLPPRINRLLDKKK